MIIGSSYVKKLPYRYIFAISSTPLTLILGAGYLATSCASDTTKSFFCQESFLDAIHFVAAGTFGFMGAILWTAQSTYINECSSTDNKGKFFGIFWSFQAASQITGNLFVGLILRYFGLSGVFLISGGIAALYIVLFLFIQTPESTVFAEEENVFSLMVDKQVGKILESPDIAKKLLASPKLGRSQLRSPLLRAFLAEPAVKNNNQGSHVTSKSKSSSQAQLDEAHIAKAENIQYAGIVHAVKTKVKNVAAALMEAVGIKGASGANESSVTEKSHVRTSFQTSRDDDYVRLVDQVTVLDEDAPATSSTQDPLAPLDEKEEILQEQPGALDFVKFFANNRIKYCFPLFMICGYGFNLYVLTLPQMVFNALETGTTAEKDEKVGAILLVFGICEVLYGQVFGIIFDKFRQLSAIIYCFMNLGASITLYFGYLTGNYYLFLVSAIFFAGVDVGGQTFISSLLSVRFVEKIEPFVVFRIFSTVMAMTIQATYMIFPQINPFLTVVVIYHVINLAVLITQQRFTKLEEAYVRSVLHLD